MNDPALISLIESVTARAKVAQRDRALLPIEKRLSAEMSKAFAIHKKVFMAELDRSVRKMFTEAVSSTIVPVEGALNLADYASFDAFSYPLQDAAAAAIQAAISHRVAEFETDFAFNIKNTRATNAIRNQAAKTVSNITSTTRKELSAILTKGMDEGQSYSQVARNIVAKYKEFGVGSPLKHLRTRAELIAVTEMGQAYETGNRIVIDEMADVGLDMEKSWSTVGDERVSQLCRTNAAAGWIGLDVPFPSGHQYPPGHPGCRSATLYRRVGSEMS